jgi:hypothetical protein
MKRNMSYVGLTRQILFTKRELWYLDGKEIPSEKTHGCVESVTEGVLI